MKVLCLLVNVVITFCVALTFLLLICIADPLVKLVSAMAVSYTHLQPTRQEAISYAVFC